MALGMCRRSREEAEAEAKAKVRWPRRRRVTEVRTYYEARDEVGEMDRQTSEGAVTRF